MKNEKEYVQFLENRVAELEAICNLSGTYRPEEAYAAAINLLIECGDYDLRRVLKAVTAILELRSIMTESLLDEIRISAN